MTAATGSQALERLRASLVGEDPQLAGALRPAGDLARENEHGSPARLAASGPRVAGRPDEYELLVGLIHEGYRLHYAGEGAVVAPHDRDLALLLGDQLYALGLDRLARLGDLEAVAELADVISLAAQARTEGAGDLAEAVWEAGAVAVGWGAGDGHRHAKELARAGDAGASHALHQAASQARGQAPEAR